MRTRSVEQILRYLTTTFGKIADYAFYTLNWFIQLKTTKLFDKNYFCNTCALLLKKLSELLKASLIANNFHMSVFIPIFVAGYKNALIRLLLCLL